MIALAALLAMLLLLGSCPGPGNPNPGDQDPASPSNGKAPFVDSYMIYYGILTNEALAVAKRYPLVILHPGNGSVTREKVAELQAAGVKVVLYISVGEDLRTVGLLEWDDGAGEWRVNVAAMKADPRFTLNGLGPTVDPRPELSAAARSAARARAAHPDGAPLSLYIGPGNPSPGGIGFASFYVDDNSVNNSGAGDGIPDFNLSWGAAFVNAGDPVWFEVLDAMRASEDGQYGMAEILTEDYGAGLGADGLFLDTIDTCGPNGWTNADSYVESEFEWTAPGFSHFIRRIRERYPDKIIVQNRGLFLLNKDLRHYGYTTRPYIDYLLFESYYMDSNIQAGPSPYFMDNRYNYMPKLVAEASRADGFQILSLEYYKNESQAKTTDDIRAALLESEGRAGFRSYVTNRNVDELNTLAKDIRTVANRDSRPPEWSSTATAGYSYGAMTMDPVHAPRVGLRTIFAEAPSGVPGAGTSAPGTVYLDWDVALDENGVEYVAYLWYGTNIWDAHFADRPAEAEAVVQAGRKLELSSLMYTGRGYATTPGYDYEKPTYAFEAKITGLESGKQLFAVVRARDRSSARNMEKNLNAVGIQVP